jgi:WD40 repeat protein
VAFSPDGKTLASGNSTVNTRGTVRLWEVTSGEEIRPLPGHRGQVFSLGFSPDGKLVASAGEDGTVRLWDAVTTREIRTLSGHNGRVFSVTFSPDGRTVVSGGEDWTVRWWDTAGKQRRPRKAKGMVRSIAFAPDGKTFATACWDGFELEVVQIWDAASGGRLRVLAASSQVVFMPNSKAVVAGNGKGQLCIWDAVNGWRPRPLWEGKTGNLFAFSKNGKTIAVPTSDRTVDLLDVGTGRSISTMRWEKGYIWSLAYSRRGIVAVGGDDNRIRLWQAATGKRNGSFVGHERHVECLTFSPDGKSLASASEDGAVLIWKVPGSGESTRPGKLKGKDLRALWSDLADDQPRRAQGAIWALAAAPAEAVPFLAQRLRPVPAAVGQKIHRLINDLNDRRFRVRKSATKDLAGLGKVAEPALQQQLAADETSLEVKVRVKLLLKRLEGAAHPPEERRALRAVQVLADIGTAEARRVLRSLAQGAGGTPLTEEARAALKRLGKRIGTQP